jgi:hypothetical protein
MILIYLKNIKEIGILEKNNEAGKAILQSKTTQTKAVLARKNIFGMKKIDYLR